LSNLLGDHNVLLEKFQLPITVYYEDRFSTVKNNLDQLVLTNGSFKGRNVKLMKYTGLRDI